MCHLCDAISTSLAVCSQQHLAHKGIALGKETGVDKCATTRQGRHVAHYPLGAVQGRLLLQIETKASDVVCILSPSQHGEAHASKPSPILPYIHC